MMHLLTISLFRFRSIVRARVGYCTGEWRLHQFCEYQDYDVDLPLAINIWLIYSYRPGPAYCQDDDQVCAQFFANAYIGKGVSVTSPCH